MHTHQIVKASFLFLIKEKQILLYKRKDKSYFFDYFSVVSGNVEENETFETAIIRETLEEIGITIKPENLKVVHLMHRIDKRDESIYVFFLAKKWNGKIENREPDECEQLIWKPIHNLPNDIIPYVKDAIDNYIQKIYFKEYKWQ